MSYDYTQAVKADVVRYYRRFQPDFPQRIGSDDWHDAIWEQTFLCDDVTGGIHGYKGLTEAQMQKAVLDNLDTLADLFAGQDAKEVMQFMLDVAYWDYQMRSYVMEDAIDLAAEELLAEESMDEAVEARMESAF